MSEDQRSYDRMVDPANSLALDQGIHVDLDLYEQGCTCFQCAPCSYCLSLPDDGEEAASESDPTTKHKPVFIARDGMEKTILPEGTDSVSLVLPNGKEIEITWRHSEQTASLSCDGQFMVRPQSANVFRLEVER